MLPPKTFRNWCGKRCCSYPFLVHVVAVSHVICVSLGWRHDQRGIWIPGLGFLFRNILTHIAQVKTAGNTGFCLLAVLVLSLMILMLMNRKVPKDFFEIKNMVLTTPLITYAYFIVSSIFHVLLCKARTLHKSLGRHWFCSDVHSDHFFVVVGSVCFVFHRFCVGHNSFVRRFKVESLEIYKVRKNKTIVLCSILIECN